METCENASFRIRIAFSVDGENAVVIHITRELRSSLLGRDMADNMLVLVL